MSNSKSKTTGREQVDVTGLIGQYEHGNEPSHHMAYLYNYVGKPEKTNEKVKYILDNFYTNTPDGLIGNEDCGQMSAWYVLSSMGIYNVTPGHRNFNWNVIEPFFDQIKVKLENGSNGVINKNEKFVDNSNFGFHEVYLRDIKKYDTIVPVPVIQAESKAFKDNLKIEMKSQNPNDVIYFMISDKDDHLAKKIFVPYTKPFEIQETSTVEAYVKTNEGQSNTISATFFKKPNNYTIVIKSKYNPQYHAGGPEGLLDGILGTENWRKGDWQGYQSQDFEAVVDLKEVKELYSFKANFLQDSRSWILMPTYLEFFISTDNVNFTSVGSLDIAKYSEIDPKDENSFTREFGVLLDKKKTARYVKVIAKNFGKLPEWHQGFGGDAFIFIDEITIK